MRQRAHRMSGPLPNTLEQVASKTRLLRNASEPARRNDGEDNRRDPNRAANRYPVRERARSSARRERQAELTGRSKNCNAYRGSTSNDGMLKADVDFGQNGKMWNLVGSFQSQAEHNFPRHSRYMLWIDGVGSYLLCLSDRVTIGGPCLHDESADIALLANLSRKHVTIVRDGEGYYLEAHASTRVAGRSVDGRVDLNNQYDIELGNNVRLRFWLPTVLSSTAVLEFVSDHRPSRSVDGVILMEDNCLLGPGRENHVRCPEWPESVVLYLRDGRFCCRSRVNLFVGTKLLGESQPFGPGDVVTGGDIGFRIETADL